MSSEFPFVGSTATVEDEDLPLLKEYAWNFETDKFILKLPTPIIGEVP